MRGGLATVACIIAGASLLQAANSILGALLPLEVARSGGSGTAAGALATGYGVGFLAGCLTAARIIRRLGHIRTFAALAAICAILTQAMAADADFVKWLLLRTATGYCLAGMFATAEGWLAGSTAATGRGRILAFYIIGSRLAGVLGQALLASGVADATGILIVCSALFSAALVPVTAAPVDAPPPRLVDVSLPRLWRIAPAALVGMIGAGLVNGAAGGLLPVYGTMLGLSVAFSIALLSLTQLGSLICQWPLGWISDKVDRRLVLAGLTAAVCVISLLVASGAAGSGAGLAAAVLAWGACSQTTYAICVAHAADHADPGEMVVVTSSALLAWGTGAMIGPAIAAPLLDLIGPPGFFLYTAAVSGAVAGFVVWRRRARAAPPERTPFVNVPATTTTLGELDPRSSDEMRRGEVA